MRAPRGVWALALGLAAAPLAAQGQAAAAPPAIDYAAERAAIARFQDADQRLQDVGWTLAHGNARFCAKAIPGVGLQLQDMTSYGAPGVARRALGLARDFAVETAARGSPAGLEGSFTRNREIARIAGADPNAWPARGAMDWQRLARAHDQIDAALARDGAVTIDFADGASVRLAPVPVCATRFELMGEGTTAVADGSRVVIGINFPAFAYEEPVFAALVAHELAHNVLDHDAWLNRNGRSDRNVRTIEREADRLIPWLLANAGYDPGAAVTFMTRWGKSHDSGLRLRRGHEGWDERAKWIAAELSAITRLMAAEGAADWPAHFRRAIDPAGGRIPGPKR